MNLTEIYNNCYISDHTSSDKFVRDSVSDYFIREILKAQDQSKEISRFIMSYPDFGVLSICILNGIDYNFNRKESYEPIANLYGVPLYLKENGNVESHYKYPQSCGYLGILTKNEIN